MTRQINLQWRLCGVQTVSYIFGHCPSLGLRMGALFCFKGLPLVGQGTEVPKYVSANQHIVGWLASLGMQLQGDPWSLRILGPPLLNSPVRCFLVTVLELPDSFLTPQWVSISSSLQVFDDQSIGDPVQCLTFLRHLRYIY